MKVVAPIAASSSTAIAVEGEPMPVEQTETAGSPGRRTTSPTSPGLQRMWYCKSPIADVSLRGLLAGDRGFAGAREGRTEQQPQQGRGNGIFVRDGNGVLGGPALGVRKRFFDADRREFGIEATEVRNDRPTGLRLRVGRGPQQTVRGLPAGFAVRIADAQA